MLKIFLQENALVFKDLDDDLYLVLIQKYKIRLVHIRDSYILEGSPDQLYRILLMITKDYDVDIW